MFKLFRKNKINCRDIPSSDKSLSRISYEKSYTLEQVSGRPDIDIFGGAITLRDRKPPLFHREFTTDKCRFRGVEFSIDISKIPLTYKEILKEIREIGFKIVNFEESYGEMLPCADEYEKTHGYFCIDVDGHLVFFENVKTS